MQNSIIYSAYMGNVITEITPLSEFDCFYLVDRYKDGFDYPIHKHREMEINFVTDCKGCQRIAGDSIETLDYYDLAVIGPNIEHGWLQNGMPPKPNMREITIQWDQGPHAGEYLNKTQLSSVREFFIQAQKGIAFGQDFIKSMLPHFEALVAPQPGFLRFLKFQEIIFYMSVTNDKHTLSTTAFANITETSDSRRITKIKNYINNNFAKPLYLDDLAAMVSMTPTAFSRFFKSRTNQTLSDYIIDTRIGHAIRLLVDTTMTSAEICYMCGFNNISNFNRLFRKKKGCSPKEFRNNYVKTKIIV